MPNSHYGDKDGLKVLSYNAIYSVILSNRNYGKTWTFKKRAFRRALKHGKKTIWIRLFKKEAKECIDTFFSSLDLQAYCGISIYDKDNNPTGNVKQRGKTFYYRTGPKRPWHWFLKVYSLSDVGALRSADDVAVDTIVFDEFTKPPMDYRRFRGNIATAFTDIFISTKREHKVNCILIGNKESVANPIFNYFGVKPLPASFEGIRKFRKGSIVVQQINNKESTKGDYGEKLMNLLKGTAYGNYLYNGEYKGATGLKPRKTPANALIYCQVIINGQPLKISIHNGYFYVNGRIENTKPIYCDVIAHKYKLERQLVKRHKTFFNGLVNAIADNRVYFDGEASHEVFTAFMSWLGI